MVSVFYCTFILKKVIKFVFFMNRISWYKCYNKGNLETENSFQVSLKQETE